MSEFQFSKTHRVIVPADCAGAEGVQGVVTVNVARLGREPYYEVQWLASDTVDEKGNLVMLCTDVSESDLIKAQPPKMIAVTEAERLVGVAHALAADAEAQLREHLLAKRRKSRKAVSRKRR